MSSLNEMPETLQQTDLVLRRVGTNAEKMAWILLSSETNVEQVLALKQQAGLEGDEVERLLLWYAARQSLPQIPQLRVDESVRDLLDKDLRQLPGMKVSMAAGSYHFDRAAKMATLRRFPVGPMEWEMSGVPRSFFLKATFPDNLRFLAFVLFRMRGRKPCFFMHVAPAPRNRALSIPKEVLRAYYRMAKSMELQPEVLGLVAFAWFHDPSAVRDYPHLEVLNRPYVKEGGTVVLLEPAPLSSGVVAGNAQRGADYEAGKVQYRYGFAMWPRDAAIRWAEAHSELESKPLRQCDTVSTEW